MSPIELGSTFDPGHGRGRGGGCRDARRRPEVPRVQVEGFWGDEGVGEEPGFELATQILKKTHART